MIEKLLYPKELKDVIRTLRDDGRLNENVLRVLNRLIYCSIIVWLLLTLLAYSGGSYIVFFLFLILGPFLLWKSIKGSYRIYMVPYLEGEKVEGYVSDIKYYPYEKIEYYVHSYEHDKTYCLFKGLEWNRIPRPQINDPLTIYTNPVKNKCAMPDHEYFKNKYCLDKNL